MHTAVTNEVKQTCTKGETKNLQESLRNKGKEI